MGDATASRNWRQLSVFDRSGEYPLRFPKPIACIKQAIDHGAIARPLLDFVEVAASARSGLSVSCGPNRSLLGR
jgi:hypothetical protein